MNGSKTNARRRRTHTSDPSAVPGNYSGFNENIYNGGRGKKSHEPKFQGQVRRYARRKGKGVSRIKSMCSKLGKLRRVDVALFVAFAVKIASFLYSRRISSLRHVQQTDSPSLSQQPEPPEVESLSDKWLPPKWVRRWVDHKMPFRVPLLYRREDDDYSFGYDSQIDDDWFVHRKQQKKIRFKGMFPANSYYRDYKEQLNGHGYAVVDRVLYNADGYRETTLLALTDSEFQLNPVSDELETSQSHRAFEFRDDEDLHGHHFYDDDEWDHYYSFDDDTVRGTLGMGLSKEGEEETHSSDPSEQDGCTQPSFFRTYYPTCNEMHASLSGYSWLLGEEVYSRRWKKRKHLSSDRSHLSKYLSHGYYRDAFLFQPAYVSHDEEDRPSTQWDEVVFKTMRHMYRSSGGVSEDDEISDLELGFDPDDKYTFTNYREDMRKDAMVMELLTSSPRAIDIYSHCSMSSVIEFAPTDIEEIVMPTMGYSPKKLLRRGSKNVNDLDESLNDLLPEEKLEMALEMAKCLASMHGFVDGVIAHVDVQVGQFFRGRDGMIKFVDYNRAEPLLYDTKNDKYCKWTNGEPSDGVFRAPEENIDAPLTEKIDVYSLGNVFYSILTGRLVWEDYEYDERTRRIVEGVNLPIPEIYNESPISHDLVRATYACWTNDAEERPSIFEVVEFLEESVATHSNQ